MDATESKIVVAGYTSQKVWVFGMEEEDTNSLTMVPDFLVKMSQLTRPRSKNLVTKLTKFIAATGGVTKVQIHSDNDRLAVLLPHSQSVEIWNIQLVTRLHRSALMTKLIPKHNVPQVCFDSRCVFSELEERHFDLCATLFRSCSSVQHLKL